MLDGWRALAAAIALQALCDATSRDVWKALDACTWLASGDFEVLADRMPGDGISLLTSGNIARMEHLLMKWRNS